MKESIVVIGAGGHAKVCIELLRAMGRQVDYCIGGSDSAECVGVPVLDGDENILRLREQGYVRAFVAVGSNALRARLAALALAQGYELVNAISPRAVISLSARIGRGVAVMAGAVVNAECDIADLAIINTGATVDHDCRIGAAAHLAPQTALAGCVSVGAQSFLGIGSKIIPGVTIGSNTTIGAGAVVIADVADDVIALGVPARVIKYKHA